MAAESDAIDQAMDLQLRLGTALDPASTARFHRTTIHGVFSETSDFEPVPYYSADGYQWKFELAIEEL